MLESIHFTCYRKSRFGEMANEEHTVMRFGEIYLHATWAGKDLFLMIISGTDAWRGQLMEDHFKAIEEKNIGSSMQLAKEAFRAPSENHAISLERGKLVWKKVGAKAKMVLAKIDLVPVNFLDAQKEIFDHLVDTNREITLKNKEYTRRQENLVTELKKSRTMLRDFEKVKNEIEDRLYETFLPILNSKKRKIRELEEQLGGGRTSAAAGDGDEDYGSVTEEDDSDREEERLGDDVKTANLSENDSLNLLNDSF